MTKQEFAIKLLFWLMPYPLSKMLPRILQKLLDGPSAEVPDQWAQASFDVISSVLTGVVAESEALLFSIEGIIPTEQLSALALDLRASIETAEQDLSLLSDIVSEPRHYILRKIRVHFSAVFRSINVVINLIHSFYRLIPSPPFIKPPFYTPPVNPIFIGPPVPGPTGPGPSPIQSRWLRAVWMFEKFLTIDPAVWTDYSSGTGVCSIDTQRLKMVSQDGASYAYLLADPDDTFPETCRITFNLKVISGTGLFQLSCKTGAHQFDIRFHPPDVVKVRQSLLGPLKEYDVGDYVGSNVLWRFLYNGDTFDLFRGSQEIDTDIVIYELTTGKGERFLMADNIISLYFDEFKIVYPV